MRAYILIDLDNFGDINKKFGYVTGNKVLKAFKSHVNNWFKKDGVIFHIGADELLVEFSGARNQADLEEKLNGFMSQSIIFQSKEKRKINLTTSIGVSIEYEHGLKFWDLVRYADIALFHAKKNGKNQFKIYHKHLETDVIKNIELAQNIREGVLAHEFKMHYQPIVDASTESVVGFEALVRWQHPTRGFIPPDDFIQVAENSGQIIFLEYWIIAEVFRHAEQILKRATKPYFFSINLSAKGLLTKNLPEFIEELLEKHKVLPENIVFEGTETALIQDFDRSQMVLNKLVDLGFTIALDDFGTGYSSLNYLRKLPVGKVKLDKSFIDNIETCEKDRILTQTIIELSHGLDLKIVVEGIERFEQIQILKNLNCDYFQGYFFSKPIPYDQIFKHL